MENFIKWTKKYLNQILIILGVLSIIATLVISNNEKIARERRKESSEIFQKTMAKLDYDNCMSEAFSTYQDNWQSNCKGKGLKPDCMLQSSLAEYLGEVRSKDEKDCMELYKLQLK